MDKSGISHEILNQQSPPFLLMPCIYAAGELTAAAGLWCQRAKAGCSQAIITAFALRQEACWQPRGKQGISMELHVRSRISCSDLSGFVHLSQEQTQASSRACKTQWHDLSLQGIGALIVSARLNNNTHGGWFPAGTSVSAHHLSTTASSSEKQIEALRRASSWKKPAKQLQRRAENVCWRKFKLGRHH